MPRRREYPPEPALQRLREAGEKRAEADAELRAAVYAAKDAGGSVRVIAEEARISTNTVQVWLKQRK
ncbi:hypothetical protein P5G50_18215 [Leifsonia sp. F6_8S_P_1B]|uniref:Homeodomain-like domain-containing protein n=1 Tax=Leifsonia williamsii TaxID=3035919 RepID=A0ABT8KG03_9MICO|nr:hypothetical protein [Leifsonia williamsii]MDN4616386.1 hypothetical protein [Leifsonia williamsii]